MKIIKKLNNNVAIGIDNNENECIIFGKGIGFPKIPYDLMDLSKIDRTYYKKKKKYLGLIDEIPEEIFSISSKIVEKAKINLNCELNPNLLFTLADHINFSIERLRNNIEIKNPLAYDIEHLYSKEMIVGFHALKYIKEILNVELPRDEASSIAIHIVNAEAEHYNMEDTIKNTKVLKEILDIITSTLDKKIDENSYSYSRFIIHMRYLIKRCQNNVQISSVK